MDLTERQSRLVSTIRTRRESESEGSRFLSISAIARWVGVLAVLALCSLPAQGQELEKKLTAEKGKWVIDLQASKELGAQAAAAVDQLQVLGVSFLLEFSAKGKFAVTHFIAGKERSKKTGEWKVLKETDDRLFLDITNEGEASPSKMIIEFLLDGRIKISPEKKPKNKDPTLVFRRA